MSANTNYNDCDTITRVLSIVRTMNPNMNIGTYLAHAPSRKGDGVKVKLTNGEIIVTYDAINDVDHGYSTPNYSDIMVKTFQSNQTNAGVSKKKKKSFWEIIKKYMWN